MPGVINVNPARSNAMRRCRSVVVASAMLDRQFCPPIKHQLCPRYVTDSPESRKFIYGEVYPGRGKVNRSSRDGFGMTTSEKEFLQSSPTGSPLFPNHNSRESAAQALLRSNNEEELYQQFVSITSRKVFPYFILTMSTSTRECQ
jgi:hypothetical protein